MFEDINGYSLDADVVREIVVARSSRARESNRETREEKKGGKEEERETKKQTPPITFNRLLDNIVPRAPIHTTAINILNASLVYAARVFDPRSVLEREAARSGRHESFVYVPPESPRVITVYYGGPTTGFTIVRRERG